MPRPCYIALYAKTPRELPKFFSHVHNGLHDNYAMSQRIALLNFLEHVEFLRRGGASAVLQGASNHTGSPSSVWPAVPNPAKQLDFLSRALPELRCPQHSSAGTLSALVQKDPSHEELITRNPDGTEGTSELVAVRLFLFFWQASREESIHHHRESPPFLSFRGLRRLWCIPFFSDLWCT